LALGLLALPACGPVVIGGDEPSAESGVKPGHGTPSSVQEACPEVAAESIYCLTSALGSQLVLVGLDSGDACPITSFGADGRASSQALLGDDAYMCSEADGTFIKVSTLTGAVETAPSTCQAVAAYEGGLLVKPSFEDPDNLNKLFFYASFTDVLNDTPTSEISIDDNNTRMTVQGSTLYTAWHSTNRVDVWTLPSPAKLPSIVLEGFDDWVMGMWATTDGRLVIASREHILTFDAATGAVLSTVAPALQDWSYGGLTCWTNPAAPN
jgi:hypothetical protein